MQAELITFHHAEHKERCKEAGAARGPGAHRTANTEREGAAEETRVREECQGSRLYSPPPFSPNLLALIEGQCSNIGDHKIKMDSFWVILTPVSIISRGTRLYEARLGNLTTRGELVLTRLLPAQAISIVGVSPPHPPLVPPSFPPHIPSLPSISLSWPARGAWGGG